MAGVVEGSNKHQTAAQFQFATMNLLLTTSPDPVPSSFQHHTLNQRFCASVWSISHCHVQQQATSHPHYWTNLLQKGHILAAVLICDPPWLHLCVQIENMRWLMDSMIAWTEIYRADRSMKCHWIWMDCFIQSMIYGLCETSPSSATRRENGNEFCYHEMLNGKTKWRNCIKSLRLANWWLFIRKYKSNLGYKWWSVGVFLQLQSSYWVLLYVSLNKFKIPEWTNHLTLSCSAW